MSSTSQSAFKPAGGTTKQTPSNLRTSCRRRAHRIAVPLLGAIVAACGGQPSARNDDADAGAATAGSLSEAKDDATAPPNTPSQPRGETRIARLTHHQYDNSVADLLYLSDVAPSAAFLPDPTFGGYNNGKNTLQVANRLGRDYRRAAESLAQQVVSSDEAMAQLVPCSQDAANCEVEFIQDFGLRAFRRPLTDSEVTRYHELFRQGSALVATGNAFADGVRVVVEAMLQSPKFLYRAELSDDSNAPIALNGYELAQRLSYALWNTTPDASLLQAARAGTLGDASELKRAAARMLDNAQAHDPVRDFHSQWLRLSRTHDLQRDELSFPLFDSHLPLEEETLAFVEHVVFDLEAGYDTLMTGSFSFLNEDLARLYGVEGVSGQELRKVDLDSGTRRGLLTQLGFLASNAYPSDTSPIHRGVFIHRQLLCNDIPDPPPGLNISASEVDNPRTTREAVEQQTSGEACSACHSLINPPGFAFEGYDAAGQLRETDRGNPINTRGSFVLDGEVVEFEGALDLIDAIADSQQARRCLATNLLRYTLGRDERSTDAPLLTSLADSMKDNNFGIKAALLSLVQSQTFLTRPANED